MRALGGRPQARPIVAEVVDVDAVDDRRNPAPGGFAVADLVQIVLAEVAAVDRVRGVAGDVELVRVDDEVLDAERARELAASSVSSSGVVGETVVSATRRSPSTSCATRRRKLESTPPENATSTRFMSPSRRA